MECLNSGLDFFLKRSIQTYVINSHTVTYTPIVAVVNPALLEFNFSGRSDYNIDLNSMGKFLRIKLVKPDVSDIETATANTVGCVNNFLFHCLFLSVFR